MSKILVDVSEFQSRVVECITSKEVDDIFNATVFSDDPRCKSAMIHGMAIASMLPSTCKLFHLEEVPECEETYDEIVAERDYYKQALEEVRKILNSGLDCIDSSMKQPMECR